MSLMMNKYRIPKRKGSLHVLGDVPVRMIIEGQTVWEIPKVTQLFTSSTSIVIPQYVTRIRLCGSASGGGGSATMGGSAGQIVSNTAFPVVPGEQIIIVIGDGGLSGQPGEDCSFGGLTLSGGASGNYSGSGSERTTCGGRHYDGGGSGGGGQASTHGNGGDPGQPGIRGSGGGTNAAGGKGVFQVSYFFEDF